MRIAAPASAGLVSRGPADLVARIEPSRPSCPTAKSGNALPHFAPARRCAPARGLNAGYTEHALGRNVPLPHGLTQVRIGADLWIQRCCASMRAIAAGWPRNALIFSRGNRCAILPWNSGGLPGRSKRNAAGARIHASAASLCAPRASLRTALRLPTAVPRADPSSGSGAVHTARGVPQQNRTRPRTQVGCCRLRHLKWPMSVNPRSARSPLLSEPLRGDTTTGTIPTFSVLLYNAVLRRRFESVKIASLRSSKKFIFAIHLDEIRWDKQTCELSELYFLDGRLCRI
jgi:hypothetical protein